MRKLNKDNKGFSGVELLLVIIIVVLIGIVGWFVYKNHKSTTISSKISFLSNPYAGWRTIEGGTTANGTFSIKIPSTWVYKTCSVNIETILVASSSSLLGLCMGDPGEISFYSITDNNSSGSVFKFIEDKSNTTSNSNYIYSSEVLNNASGFKTVIPNSSGDNSSKVYSVSFGFDKNGISYYSNAGFELGKASYKTDMSNYDLIVKSWVF